MELYWCSYTRCCLRPSPISRNFFYRASLHFFEEIKRKDIRVGDYVIVEKAGEIISQIIEVDVSKRKRESEPHIAPARCP